MHHTNNCIPAFPAVPVNTPRPGRIFTHDHHGLPHKAGIEELARPQRQGDPEHPGSHMRLHVHKAPDQIIYWTSPSVLSSEDTRKT
jgi:hypothetical protein